jgi:hypothetical protein
MPRDKKHEASSNETPHIPRASIKHRTILGLRYPNCHFDVPCQDVGNQSIGYSTLPKHSLRLLAWALGDLTTSSFLPLDLSSLWNANSIMLCELCKDIFRGDLPSKRMESVKRDRNKAPPHHTTIDGFRNSIQRCFICAMIWSHVDETDRHRISLQHCRNRSDQPLTRYWFYGDPPELALHIFFCDDEMSYASSNRTFELSQIESMSRHRYFLHLRIVYDR